MLHPRALAQSWKEEAEMLRLRYGHEQLAALCLAHAEELEESLKISLDEELTLRGAAQTSGYSYSHIRRLVDDGEIPNVGKTGSPRVRLGDLPFKPGKAAPLGALNAAKRVQTRMKAGGKVRPVG